MWISCSTADKPVEARANVQRGGKILSKHHTTIDLVVENHD